MVAALIVTSFLPALAWAAQVTERSITLSSATPGETGVTYQVKFTAAAAAGAAVIDFCSNSPLLGQTCTPPAGMDAKNAATSGGFSIAGTSTDNKVAVTGTISASPTVTTITLTNIKNPTAEGTMYARIVSFTNTGGATGYTSTAPGTHIDDGAVALAIVPAVKVSGDVLETLTFCVSGPDATDHVSNPITDGCEGDLTPPTLKLGKTTGTVIAMDSSDVWEGTVFTQISTNASKGAVIRMRSDATGCGGLLRSSDTSKCDIAPALNTDIANGEAKFGVKLGTAAISDPTDGDLRPAPSSNYNNTTYVMNYVAGDATGVTSTYGDPILDTNSKPASNRNMPLIFGASVSPNTPAGSYAAALSLVATGTF